MNQDFMSGGVYRAFIIKRSDSRVFIPGLCDKNILDSNGNISNEIPSNCWKSLRA